MAFTEKIALKSKHGIIELVPNKDIRVNPSPSNDPWFDDPRNLAELDKGVEQLKAGRVGQVTLDELKEKLGL